MHGIAHGTGQETENFPVRFAVALRFDQFADALEAAIAGGVDRIVFTPGCGREDDVGVFAGLVEENILNGDEIDGIECPSDFRKVRVRLSRVFADDVVSMNLLFRVLFTEDLGRTRVRGNPTLSGRTQPQAFSNFRRTVSSVTG
mgnify:CR=1 FL=1